MLIQFLAPSVINGGRGFIRPITEFPQYDEDVILTSVQRLKEWPQGFYRNRVTKELQFFIKTNNLIACFDALPGIDGPTKIITLAEEKTYVHDIHMLTTEQLAIVHHELSHVLLSLTKDLPFVS